ncbi:MAG: fibronectin type III domain-containing protein [Eubacterium sp.]|nr:fibronectin type III domain-containing protein [Eubacterium sp.]
MKKLLSIALCLVMILTAVAVPASAYAASVGQVKSVKVVKTTTSSVSLKWKKVKGATGYQVYYSTKKKKGYKKAKTIKKGKTVKVTIKKLKSNKKYYFKVRALKKKKKGKYSKVVAGKTKAVAKKPSTKPVTPSKPDTPVTPTDPTDPTNPDDKSRSVKINVVVPAKGANTDTLEFYINDSLVNTQNIALDGGTYSYTSSQKYEGSVSVKIKLVNENYEESKTINANNKSVDFRIESDAIDNQSGGRD